MNSNNGKLQVAYFLKMFPRLSETFILNEMLELEKSGVEITVFSLKKPNEGKFHPQLSDLKAAVYYLEDFDTKKWASWLGPVWPRLSRGRNDLWELMEKALIRADVPLMDTVLWSAWASARVMELNISHIHSHFGSLSSTLAYFASRIASVPFSFTAHAKDIYVYDMEEHLLAEKLAAARFVVTVTEYNREFLYEHNPNLDPGKIKVVYNGVNLEDIKYVPQEDRENSFILGVGRLVPKKGFDTLIEACGILKERNIDFKCVIAGDGPDLEILLRQRDELGLDGSIEFTGAMTQREIIELMSRATVLCLPCRVSEDGNRDALPTVLLESLACGLPAVSTGISGIPEIINSGEDGALVHPDDPVSTADEIQRLLGSPELRRKYSGAGLKKARERFNLNSNVAVLKDLIARSVRSGPIVTGVS